MLRYKVLAFAIPDAKSRFVSTGWASLLLADSKSATFACVAAFPPGFLLFDMDETSSIPAEYGCCCDIIAMSQQPWGAQPDFEIDLPFMSLKNALPASIRPLDGNSSDVSGSLPTP